MPRNYERKSLRATSYTQDDLLVALERVKSGELTIYRASKVYGIPTSTIHDRVTEKTGIASKSLGRPPAIPLEAEEKLAASLKILEKWGFGLSRLEVLLVVSEYDRCNKIQTPFKNDTPGPDWFINFRKRHRLSIKKPQNVENSRRKMTDPFIVFEYFKLLEKTLTELCLFDKPQRIWNLDETSVALDPSKTKVVGGIGLPCSRTTAGSGRENITVLTTVSANAEKLSPLIIFKGKNVYDTWMAAEKENQDFELSYASSKKGWMETEIFYNYMEKVVIPGVGNERPVLIIYDGHSTHVDVKVVDLARRNNIIILKLPPHTSHLLQPLDLAVFKSLKSQWDAQLVEWQRKNVGTKLQKRTFSEMFAESWSKLKPENIESGFRKAGIYPFNSAVIPKEKFDPGAYKRWQQKIASENANVQSPKTLQRTCLEAVNSLLFRTDIVDGLSETELISQMETTQTGIKKSEQSVSFQEVSDDVCYLSDIPKNNSQMLPFVAKYPNNIPSCLQTHKYDSTKNKIHKAVDGSKAENNSQLLAIEARKYNDASKHNNKVLNTIIEIPSKHKNQFKPKYGNENQSPCHKNYSSKINILSNNVITFEELLLKKVQSTKRDEPKVTKRRVATGAEVITASLSRHMFEEREKVSKTNENLEKQKEKNKRKKNNEEKDTQKRPPIKKRKLSKGSSKTKRQIARKESSASESDHTVSDDTIVIANEEISMDPGPSGILKGSVMRSRENNNNVGICTTKNRTVTENSTKLTTSKGKGIGKKSSGKESRLYMQDQGNSKPKLLKKKNDLMSSKESTTSVSGTMSTHSDSDILDFLSDYAYFDEPYLENQETFMQSNAVENEEDISNGVLNNETTEKEKTEEIFMQTIAVENEEDINNGILINETEEKDKTEEIFMQNKAVENEEDTTNDVLNNETEKKEKTEVNTNNEDNNNSKSEDIEMEQSNIKDVVSTENIYCLNDHVLVRYYTRNKWTYYVGIIERKDNDESYFTIRFFKTVKKPNLRFIMPKKTDRDVVPNISIVKKVDLKQMPHKSNEYVFSNEDNTVYF